MNKSKSFITVQTCAGSSTERATVLVRMLRMSAIVLQQQQGLVLLFPSTSSKFRGDLPVHSKQRGTQQLQKLSALRPHLVGERPCICRFARVGVLKYNFLLPLSRSGGGGFLTVGRMSSNLAAAGPPPVSSKDDGNAKETKTVNVIIKGKVQGVYYRDWTLENAKKLGVNGWVRNLRDGSVEAVFSGQSAAVSTLIENCHSGPSAARVTSVDVSAWTEEVPAGFERKSTG